KGRLTFLMWSIRLRVASRRGRGSGEGGERDASDRAGGVDGSHGRGAGRVGIGWRAGVVEAGGCAASACPLGVAGRAWVAEPAEGRSRRCGAPRSQGGFVVVWFERGCRLDGGGSAGGAE